MIPYPVEVDVLVKQHRLRTVAAGAAFVALAGLAAACSGGSSSTSATSPVTATLPASALKSAAPANTRITGSLANGTSWIAEYPQSWNGTLILYSHGYGSLTAADAPDSGTETALLDKGYALAGSSYDPGGSEWALNTAVSDQFGTLAAVESTVLPRSPGHVIAFGTSMGGLVSALEAQRGAGKINGALTTCGVVAGGVNLNDYQLDGEYVIAQLLGSPGTPLTGLDGNGAQGTASTLAGDAVSAQKTADGRARLALAMAFLNLPSWNASSATPAADETAQYNALAGDLVDSSDTVLSFMLGGRVSIEQAAGGQPAADAGLDFSQMLAASPYRSEVTSLYQAAGLNLGTDLSTLTRHATVKADQQALASLKASSVPTGKLAVPELDLHTTGDNLVPVQQEATYASLVDAAGSGNLLRQAYTDSFGHCSFSSSELVAGVEAVLTRVTSGQWGALADTSSLQQSADALNLGQARFTSFSPGQLTGATGPG